MIFLRRIFLTGLFSLLLLSQGGCLAIKNAWEEYVTNSGYCWMGALLDPPKGTRLTYVPVYSGKSVLSMELRLIKYAADCLE